MALIARNTKAGGSTDVQTGQTIAASDINTDMNTVYNEFNGNISNANISASAAIAVSKLALTGAITSAMITDGTIANGDIADDTILNAKINSAAAIALTKLDDTSGTASAAATAADPGVSNSESLATTADGEVLRLRYAIERLALGIDATRYDDTGSAETTYWGDVPVRAPQWLPGINGVVTSGLPSGWSNVNTATLAQEAANALDATAGKGRAIKITAAGSANEGISYTLSGLKASTKYAIYALVKATSGDTVRLTTTGADATSAFRNITATTTSTAWAFVGGVIQTDATPTNIVVIITTGADTDIVWVAGVCYGECAAVPLAPRVAVIEQLVASTAGTAISGVTTDSGLDTNYQFIDNGSTDLDITVYVPGDGYYIEVDASWWARDTTNQSGQTDLLVRLYQGVGGGALSGVLQKQHLGTHDGANNRQEVHQGHMVWIVKAPTVGSAYRYALAASTTQQANSTQTPQLGNLGYSSLTVKVLPYGG